MINWIGEEAFEATLGRLYGTIFDQDTWPDVLQHIASLVGAEGGLLISTRLEHSVRWLASPRIAGMVKEYAEEGWFQDLTRVTPLYADKPTRFVSETQYRTVTEIDALPVHSRFLRPRGFLGGAATVIEGAANEILQVSFEGFGSHLNAERSVKILDRLRPHIAQAANACRRIHDVYARATVSALEQLNLPAAIFREDGSIQVSNRHFHNIAESIVPVLTGIRCSATTSDRRRVNTSTKRSGVCWQDDSLVVRGGTAAEAMVVHRLPVTVDDWSECNDMGFLLVGSRSVKSALPAANLLRILFDLTPAEARFTRALLEGRTLSESSSMLKISPATGRIHLRHIFAKTGTTRQVDLVRLLGGIARPEQGQRDSLTTPFRK